MKRSTLATALTTGTLGLAGLVAASALAIPGASVASPSEDRWTKRDEDTPDVVLVADDDDDDTNARDEDTRTRDQQTRTRDTRSRGDVGADTRSNDNTGTGDRTGRDDSRDRRVKDWTQDGPGAQKRDWSVNKTNDRSRNNTRR
ncbi:hypothetical protein [Nocardioides litoris]|uniref:hypothetical protein n=1 Tax=Nocardioides litoris TaxID=1926648 RepID=UPI001121B802|nr:hypothetical protein [Nocardioides litoris]